MSRLITMVELRGLEPPDLFHAMVAGEAQATGCER